MSADLENRPDYAANPVVVLSTCKHTVEKVHSFFKDALSDVGMKFLDLTEKVSDPGNHVGPKEDGSIKAMQEAVLSQDGYSESVLEGVDALFADPEVKILVVTSFNGIHRADVACRQIEDVLNSIENAEGKRMFNCLRMPVGSNCCLGESDFMKKLDNAMV